MDQRPTKKQRELLSFIDGFIKGYGYGPSYREIMRALEYKSVSTVATHINGLITRGWLIKKDNSARTLEVMMPGEVHTIKNIKNEMRHTASAEEELRAKITELKADQSTDHTHDIEVLTQALTILRKPYEPTVA